MAKHGALDRNLSLEAVRVTEAAAIASIEWMGRGDEHSADQAAVDAMRTALNGLDIDGTVVIGEGERDEAPMLFIGEQVALDYTAEFSSFREYKDSGLPIIDRSQRKGIAHLRNGQAFYITGLRRLQNQKGQDTELLMFITCSIVEPTPKGQFPEKK